MMDRVPRLRVGFRFQWEPAQDCHVLLYPEGMIRLNQTAAAILGTVDGKRSVFELVDILEKRYPDSGSLAADICEFLETARDENWLTLKPS